MREGHDNNGPTIEDVSSQSGRRTETTRSDPGDRNQSLIFPGWRSWRRRTDERRPEWGGAGRRPGSSPSPGLRPGESGNGCPNFRRNAASPTCHERYASAQTDPVVGKLSPFFHRWVAAWRICIVELMWSFILPPLARLTATGRSRNDGTKQSRRCKPTWKLTRRFSVRSWSQCGSRLRRWRRRERFSRPDRAALTLTLSQRERGPVSCNPLPKGEGTF